MFLIQNGFIILPSRSDFSLKYYLPCDSKIYLKSLNSIRNVNLNLQEYENFNSDFLRFTYIYHNEMHAKKTDG